MNLSAWKDRLAAGKYDAPLAALYGAADAPRSRYARLCEEYLRTFGDAPDALLISAPGRTELAGNHTDHQLGIVLCAAVTLDAAAAAASAADNAVEIVSDGFGRVRVSESAEVRSRSARCFPAPRPSLRSRRRCTA